MRLLLALVVCVLLAGCATSGGVATLADGRTGSFPILTRTFPTVTGAVEQPGTVMGDLSLPGGSERAPELLVTHPRIDPRRVGVLGFSHGGWVTLWASQAWYQRRFMRGTLAPPAAYAAFYPAGCNARLINEADMAGGPVRIFHGTADDWTTIDHCREWVARRRAAGKDVSIVEYDGALHAFDVTFFARPQRFLEVVNSSGCAMFQQEDGTFTDAGGKRF